MTYSYLAEHIVGYARNIEIAIYPISVALVCYGYHFDMSLSKHLVFELGVKDPKVGLAAIDIKKYSFETLQNNMKKIPKSYNPTHARHCY